MNYLGDSNYAAAGGQLSQAVNNASTTVALSANTTAATYAQPLILTATVSSNGGTATGAVSFTDGSTTLGSATLNPDGIAVLSLSALAPGPHMVIANYGGDGKANPSASTALAIVVKQGTTLTVSADSSPGLTLSSVTLTATVHNAGAAPATGIITFTDGAAILGTAILNAANQAILAVPQLTAGTHSIAAHFPGDGANLASDSGNYNELIQLRSTVTTLTGSSTDPGNPQQVTLIAVVKGQGSIPPSGTVSFTNGNLTLGAGSLDANGVATITVIFATTSQPVEASYNGDISYQASQSASVTITAGQPAQFTLAVNVPTITLVAHQYTTVNVALGSVKGFTDTIALGCLGLPYAATCSFDKAQLKLAPDGTATASLIIDTGDPLGAGTGTSASVARSHGTTFLCWLPAGVLLCLLRRRQRRASRRKFGSLLALLLAFAVSMSATGCSGLSTSGTPPGTYSFKVVGTGQGSGTTQAQAVTLVVAQ